MGTERRGPAYHCNICKLPRQKDKLVCFVAAVIQITAVWHINLQTWASRDGDVFPLSADFASFQGCTLEGNLLLGIFSDTGTLRRASVVFLLWMLFYCQTMEMYCGVGVCCDVMLTPLQRGCESAPRNLPGGQSVEPHQSVTTTWLRNTAYDSRD